MPPKQKSKSRNEIKIINIPQPLFDLITDNAKGNRVSLGNEVLNFLEDKKYK